MLNRLDGTMIMQYNVTIMSVLWIKEFANDWSIDSKVTWCRYASGPGNSCMHPCWGCDDAFLWMVQSSNLKLDKYLTGGSLALFLWGGNWFQQENVNKNKYKNKFIHCLCTKMVITLCHGNFLSFDISGSKMSPSWWWDNCGDSGTKTQRGDTIYH